MGHLILQTLGRTLIPVAKVRNTLNTPTNSFGTGIQSSYHKMRVPIPMKGEG
jgi:hypothetical protein